MGIAKEIIKKFIPSQLLLSYHLFLAKLAAFYYSNPSNKLIVIGVTGTNGKTATVNFIAQYLECLGKQVGLSSTVNFKVGKKEWLNDKKMTMLGRFQTQKLLKQMVSGGCQYVVVETSSQGIEQFRHSGINYDLVIFTNLTPEHIEAHGSFDNYRACKEKLFEHLSKSKHKRINGQQIKKTIISNADDQETDRLRKYKVDKFLTYGFANKADYQGSELSLDKGLVNFKFNNQVIKNNLLGKFNGYNILASLAALKALGLSAEKCQLRGVPGRQEFIDQGQNFKVLVDYAPEPEGLKQLYGALKEVPRKRLIHILGSCGGGRDKARQPILGKLAGQEADIVIVTNEDPYDDNPMEIVDNVAQGAEQAGKEYNKNLFKILNRREAIKKALKLAQKDDLVLITGKGAEQAICVAHGKKIPWDDRKAVRDILQNS